MNDEFCKFFKTKNITNNFMSKLAKFIAGISFTLIVLLIAVIILSYKLVTRSHPQIDGELKSHLLIDSVYIYRDEYGIPHIFAKNEHDLYFALGYVTAQDRLWQMDLSRRIAAGRLSEIFGVDALEVDKLFRTLSLNETAKKDAKVSQ